MKDYRITVKVRNNRLLKAIENSGGIIGAKWCSANGLSYSSVNDLINMTTSPIRQGSLTPTAASLCDVLGKLPEDLWSNEQLYPLEKNFSEMEMDYAQIVAMLPSEEQSYLPDFSNIKQEQIQNLVQKALAILSARQYAVIKMRFEDELTLVECGKKLGVTPEMVRTIEARALRKLRSSVRKDSYLSDALDLVQEE